MRGLGRGEHPPKGQSPYTATAAPEQSPRRRVQRRARDRGTTWRREQTPIVRVPNSRTDAGPEEHPESDRPCGLLLPPPMILWPVRHQSELDHLFRASGDDKPVQLGLHRTPIRSRQISIALTAPGRSSVRLRDVGYASAVVRMAYCDRERRSSTTSSAQAACCCGPAMRGRSAKGSSAHQCGRCKAVVTASIDASATVPSPPPAASSSRLAECPALDRAGAPLSGEPICTHRHPKQSSTGSDGAPFRPSATVPLTRLRESVSCGYRFIDRDGSSAGS
jgi:hypothetical protein